MPVDKNKAATEAVQPKSKTASGAYQVTLFPIEIIEVYPSSQGSADLKTIGKGANSKHYAIKTIHENNGMIPASELFCYHLCRLLNIPTPDFDHVEHQSEIAFGSVWEGGVKDHLASEADFMAIISGDEFPEAREFFGKVYGLDLFINNDDRHFGNYIFRESFNNSKIGLAFDFSRAWMANDPNGDHCLHPESNTHACNQILRSLDTFDHQAAINILDEISKIHVDDITSILEQMHDTWMTDTQKKMITDWWGGQEFHDRIIRMKGAI